MADVGMVSEDVAARRQVADRMAEAARTFPPPMPGAIPLRTSVSMCSPATARRIMRDDLSNAALLLVDDEAHIDVIRRSR